MEVLDREEHNCSPSEGLLHLSAQLIYSINFFSGDDSFREGYQNLNAKSSMVLRLGRFTCNLFRLKL